MSRALNCPNCGAPINGERCAYCGAVFLDFAAIQLGAPSFVKFKVDDAYICARLVVDTLEIEPTVDTATYTDAIGAHLGVVTRGVGCDFHLDAHAVMSPEESHLVTIIKEVKP